MSRPGAVLVLAFGERQVVIWRRRPFAQLWRRPPACFGVWIELRP